MKTSFKYILAGLIIILIALFIYSTDVVILQSKGCAALITMVGIYFVFYGLQLKINNI